MKLGEALARRAELQKRMAQLATRARASAVAQEGSEPGEDPNDLLVEADELASELEPLIARINVTNSATQLGDGTTLTEALARRDVLAVRRQVLNAVLTGAEESWVRYGRSEIKMVRLVDVREVRKKVDDLSRDARELDAAIQQQNWTVELIEN